MESPDLSEDGALAHGCNLETFEVPMDTDNLNLQTSQAEVRDPHLSYNNGEPSGSGQDAALTSPEVAPPPTPIESPSASLTAPIDKEPLIEAAIEMYTGDRGVPAALRPSQAGSS